MLDGEYITLKEAFVIFSFWKHEVVLQKDKVWPKMQPID